QMPEDLLERIIKASSNKDDIILDPFGGTGTTSYVANTLGRKYITIELSEVYYKVIVERLNSKINKKELVGKTNNSEQTELF
ncbi:MAG: DNA methyltransferase, partial [Spirochaetota bacterium]